MPEPTQMPDQVERIAKLHALAVQKGYVADKAQSERWRLVDPRGQIVSNPSCNGASFSIGEALRFLRVKPDRHRI